MQPFELRQKPLMRELQPNKINFPRHCLKRLSHKKGYIYHSTGESCANHELSRNRNLQVQKVGSPKILSRFEVKIRCGFLFILLF